MFKNAYNYVCSSINKGAIVGAGGVALTVAGAQAHAAIDLTAVTASFGDITTAVPAVGALFLGALGLMAVWKLARGLFA